MRISMCKLLEGDGKMLAGSITGRKALAKLVERTDMNPTEPEEIYLDFERVDIATASFLREAVLVFRDTIRRNRPNYYPVVANANNLIVDELKVLLGMRGDALMLCTLDASGTPSNARLTGDL